MQSLCGWFGVVVKTFIASTKLTSKVPPLTLTFVLATAGRKWQVLRNGPISRTAGLLASVA